MAYLKAKVGSVRLDLGTDPEQPEVISVWTGFKILGLLMVCIVAPPLGFLLGWRHAQMNNPSRMRYHPEHGFRWKQY